MPAVKTIQELFNEGDYESVVASYAPGCSAKDAFLVLSSYLSLGKGREAMELLLKRREDLWKENPTLTMKVNFDLRFILNQFDEAYEDEKWFANQPYVSQEVEEVLRGLPKAIRANELATKGKTAAMGEDEILDCLRNPGDPYACLAALSQIKNADLEPYEEAIEGILCGPYHADVKSFALMLLSDRGYQKEVLFEKKGERMRIVPAKIGSPFATREYRKVHEEITMNGKDVSATQVAYGLLDQYCLALYPHRFVEAGKEGELASSLLDLARSYLGDKLSQKELDNAAPTRKIIEENPPLGA